MPICQAAIEMVWLLFTELDFPPIFYLKDFFFKIKKTKNGAGGITNLKIYFYVTKWGIRQFLWLVVFLNEKNNRKIIQEKDYCFANNIWRADKRCTDLEEVHRAATLSSSKFYFRLTGEVFGTLNRRYDVFDGQKGS